MPITAQPGLTEDKFPLDRLMVGLGNSWSVRFVASLAIGARLACLILPGTINVWINRITMDADQTATLNYGRATALTTPVAQPFINRDFSTTGTPTGAMTAFSDATSAALPTNYTTVLTVSGSGILETFSIGDGSPLLLRAGDTHGWAFSMGLATVATNVWVTVDCQEYPY